jgi:hypothetical protein
MFSISYSIILPLLSSSASDAAGLLSFLRLSNGSPYGRPLFPSLRVSPGFHSAFCLSPYFPDGSPCGRPPFPLLRASPGLNPSLLSLTPNPARVSTPFLQAPLPPLAHSLRLSYTPRCTLCHQLHDIPLRSASQPFYGPTLQPFSLVYYLETLFSLFSCVKPAYGANSNPILKLNPNPDTCEFTNPSFLRKLPLIAPALTGNTPSIVSISATCCNLL